MNHNRGIVLLIVFTVGIVILSTRTATSYTPPQSGLPYPTFATPSLLAVAPVSGIADGAQAWVTNQGVWSYLTACPSQCDGTDTCRAAAGGDGGVGCWQRATAGLPGAQNQSAWYVDSVNGSNSATCLAPGTSACADLIEFVRRMGQQQLNVSPTINLSGDFSDAEISLSVQAGLFNVVFVVGQRIYTGADGGSLGTWVVTASQTWDGGANQEGVVTVAPSVDGGAALPANFLTYDDLWLEDQTAPNAGLGVPVFSQLDAGVFYTTGGSIVGSDTNAVIAVGDVLRAYTLTQISTQAGTQFNVNGGVWEFENLSIGNTTHSASLGGGMYPTTAVEFYSCLVDGLDTYSGVLYAFGSAFTGGARISGQATSIIACQFDYIQVRGEGFAELSGWNLAGNPFGTGGYVVGRHGTGAGQIVFDNGPNAAINIAGSSLSPSGLYVNPGGVAVLNTPFWVRNNGSTNPSIEVTSGAIGVVYAAGIQPASVGTSSATPWSVGGTSFSTLPQLNGGTYIQSYVQGPF